MSFKSDREIDIECAIYWQLTARLDYLEMSETPRQSDKIRAQKMAAESHRQMRPFLFALIGDGEKEQ